MLIDPGRYLEEGLKNAAKAVIRAIEDDWRRNTILNTILTFGAAILGGIKAGNIAKQVAKHKLFMPKMSKTIFVAINTLFGTFKGALKGFITGLGAGKR